MVVTAARRERIIGPCLLQNTHWIGTCVALALAKTKGCNRRRRRTYAQALGRSASRNHHHWLELAGVQGHDQGTRARKARICAVVSERVVVVVNGGGSAISVELTIPEPAVRAAHDLLDAGEPVAVHRNVLRIAVPANWARVLALSSPDYIQIRSTTPNVPGPGVPPASPPVTSSRCSL
jgi:hypothetical protein